MNAQNIIDHCEKINIEDVKFQCDNCGKEFETKEDFFYHFMRCIK